ncbi:MULTISPECIES: VWA domain-containing protein [Ruegeria]|uniref:vWA domain-containing protein n=1 Tax=Ruegeria sp. HKCCA5763 TaxID=2682987 RepID=UPI00147BC752
MTDNNIELKCQFDREQFWERGDSVRYLVAKVRASDCNSSSRREREPMNIALAIDVSGSMSGGKLEAAKQAALGLVPKLSSQDRLTLVSFGSDVVTHLDAVSVDNKNLPEIEFEISRLRTRGCTNLSGGWFQAVDRAATVYEADSRLPPRVIILSDGHANEGVTDPFELRRHASELRKRGVTTSALGIGNGYDEQLLRGISENGGGRLHDAEFDTEISSVLLGELEDIFSTVADNVEVSIQYPAGFHVEILGKSSSLGHAGRLNVDLGPLQNEVERAVVAKVTCPTSAHKQRFEFTASVSARSVGGGEPFQPQFSTALLMAADRGENARCPKSSEIASIVATHWQAHVLNRAGQMNRDRAFREAANYVERELRYFEAYVRELPGSRELVRGLKVLARHVDRDISPRMHKEMTLSSELAFHRRADHRGTAKKSWVDRMVGGD